MQTLSSLSFILNLLSIYFAFKYPIFFIKTFLIAVLLFGVSILIFIYELQIAVKALDKHLEDLEDL